MSILSVRGWSCYGIRAEYRGAKTMLPWKIRVATNVVLVAIAFWLRSRPSPRRSLRRLAYAYGALFLAASFLGMAAGVLVMLDPFAGEVPDPSHAALVAMGISEPAIIAITGVVAFLIPATTALVLFLSCRDDSPGDVPG
jgi:hypothetical protein